MRLQRQTHSRKSVWIAMTQRGMKACRASRQKHPSQLFPHNRETHMGKMNGFQKTDFKRIRSRPDMLLRNLKPAKQA